MRPHCGRRDEGRAKGCLSLDSISGGRCGLPSLFLVVLKHEQPDRGGEVRCLSVFVDLGKQTGTGSLTRSGDLLQAGPERVLQADAGLVSADND